MLCEKFHDLDVKRSVLASAPLHTQDTEIGLGALVWQPQPTKVYFAQADFEIEAKLKPTDLS